ncbi:MAG TPA: aromatic amino acid transport family protein, partial [Acidimicrobiales bacterium]
MAAGSITTIGILRVLAVLGTHDQTEGTTSDGRDPTDWTELVGGLSARRARTLLFLIESRTGHLASRARQAMAPFLTDDTVRDRDLAFMDAFARGREPPFPVHVHDLERYASHWADIVPANPRSRAALARLLGQKYRFTRDAVPGMRAAVGLDDEGVVSAYEQLYAEPLDRIYADDVGAGGRLRWLWTRIATRMETLSPAWSAYVLSLTETVGTSMLALPIAVAGIGPLAGVVVLCVLGLVNIVTAAAMGEAVARSGSVRYGAAYVGKMVQDYLGRPGSVVLTASLLALTFLILVADYVGIGLTMAGATGLPSGLFVVVVFAVTLYMIRRGSLDATIAAAIVVGAVNLTVILAIALLSVPSLEVANVTRIELPFVGGRPFDATVVASLFGVILAAFFGHLAVSLCGQEVLRREPPGKALVRGVVAAQTTTLVVYCLWVMAVGGVVDGGVLAREPGTALVPLADRVGPVVNVLGSVYVVLGMGMGAIHYSLALFNLTRERLP